MATILTRHRACRRCDERPATERTDLCAECLADIDWYESREFEVDNEPTCADCGAVLHRGHCYECIERSLTVGHAAMRSAS